MMHHLQYEYKGDMHSRHLAVAVRHKHRLCDFKHNSRDPCPLPTAHKSTHAEIGVLVELMNKYHITSHRLRLTSFRHGVSPPPCVRHAKV